MLCQVLLQVYTTFTHIRNNFPVPAKTVSSEHNEPEVRGRMPSEALNASVIAANKYSLGSQTDKTAHDPNQLMMQIL